MIKLAIELEPGPGMAGEPLRMAVEDGDGFSIAEMELTGRNVLEVAVPVHSGPHNRVRFRARNGGHAIPEDPRILDFRVFRVECS